MRLGYFPICLLSVYLCCRMLPPEDIWKNEYLTTPIFLNHNGGIVRILSPSLPPSLSLLLFSKGSGVHSSSFWRLSTWVESRRTGSSKLIYSDTRTYLTFLSAVWSLLVKHVASCHKSKNDWIDGSHIIIARTTFVHTQNAKLTSMCRCARKLESRNAVWNLTQ